MAGQTFNIKINGLDEMVNLFKTAPGLMEEAMQQAVKMSGTILGSHTDSSTVPWRTGTLKRSFDPIEIGRLYARWYPRVNYARAVQFGMPSSPGRYVPAIGKRLKNGSNIGTWPGFAGRHYMEAIAAASTVEIDETFRKAIKAVMQVLNGGKPGDLQGGLINMLDSSASLKGVSGTTSAFSTALYKLNKNLGSKFDRMTYRPFKGAPRGYQMKLGEKFPGVFSKWNMNNL